MAKHYSSIVHSRFAKAAVFVATISVSSLALSNSASAAPLRVDLGTASTFAVLAGAGITNSGPTTADGTAGSDFGSEPTPVNSAELVNITVAPGSTKFDVVNPQIQLAQDDLTAAYLDAASRIPDGPVSDISGLNLGPGVYNSTSAILLDGTVTLDGGGDPDAVFIFQAVSALTIEVGSVVELVGDAQACNVFWQVGSSADIKTSSNFSGHVLALTAITVGTSATINGSLLARNASVTLLQNVFHNDECADTGSGGGGSGGDTEGLASTGANDLTMPLALGLGVTAILTAVFVVRRRRHIGRHSA